jgi:lysyl endopeptidase
MKTKTNLSLYFCLFFLLTSVLCATELKAQIRNKIVSGEKQSEIGTLSVKASRMRNYELPNIDLKNLLKEDSLERTQGKPFRFGKAVEVDIDFIRDATKLTIDDSSIFFYKISSKKAYSINLIFDRFSLASNASLEIYNNQKTMIYGPVTSKNNPSNGVFWTDLIKGESIIVQLTVIGKDTQQTKLHIDKVIHGYQNTFAGFGQSANCNRDIACPEGNPWRNEGNAVAMLLLSNGQRFCTGSLLNNACQDLTPNFLTAFHCLDSDANGALSTTEQNSVNNFVFRFLYESPTCGGVDGTVFQSINGSALRSAFQPSDFALLLLNARPTGNVTYAGWSRANIPATSAASIHHPNGDVKKISIDNDALANVAITTTWVTDVFGNPIVQCPPNTHWQTIFETGTVQPGSSGSPIFDQNRRVVGQLHGDFLNTNNDFCANRRGHYGRFDVSWNGGGTADSQLSIWLTNDPNVTQTNTITIPFITGPNLVCTTGGQFTFNNQPTGTTVNWTSSNSLGLSRPDLGLHELTCKQDDKIRQNSSGTRGYHCRVFAGRYDLS